MEFRTESGLCSLAFERHTSMVQGILWRYSLGLFLALLAIDRCVGLSPIHPSLVTIIPSRLVSSGKFCQAPQHTRRSPERAIHHCGGHGRLPRYKTVTKSEMSELPDR